MKLAISNTVIDRISAVKGACSGTLYGISGNGSITVLALGVKQNNSDPPILEDFLLEPCGVFQVGGSNVDKIVKSETFDVEELVTISRDDSGLSVGFYDNGSIKTASYEVCEETNSQFLYLNLKGEFGITCEADQDSIRDKFEDLQSDASLVFRLTKSNIFLLGSNSISQGDMNEDSTIGDVYDTYSTQQDESNKKRQKVATKPRILDVAVLKQICKQEDDDFDKKHAPVCNVNKYQKNVINTTIAVDLLAVVDPVTKVKGLYSILNSYLYQYLVSYKTRVLARFEDKKDLHLEAFHCYPRQCGHFVTLLYPKSESQEQLRSERQALHKMLLINDIVPIFRRSNAYSIEAASKPNQPLINPHEGLKPTDNGGQVALVRGLYQYYHYCQENADDNGWGCAYRSLQTLASWFKLQGYIDRNVPTFHDIQKCLVDIQDKPANFLGSKQWIGSTEVSFVLSSLLGVESKILFVSSGEEMGTKGPELVEHFTTHGSPIMIGGGVLAHTILGVDYNRESGDLRFLILDPHYTGSEDLHTIQAKGWCGWKKVNFWNKTSFYNMCMPLVPKDI